MTRIQVLLAVLCLMGLAFPPIWLVAIAVYELGVRRGKTVVGVWLSSRFW